MFVCAGVLVVELEAPLAGALEAVAEGLFGPRLAWRVCRVQSAPALTQLEHGMDESQRLLRNLQRSQD